jgi:hypothetical protein
MCGFITLLFLSGCKLTPVSQDSGNWIQFKSDFENGKTVHYKFPNGAKYIVQPEQYVSLETEQNIFAHLGYDPGDQSNAVSELWVQLGFQRYLKSDNSKSIEGLTKDIHDLIKHREYGLNLYSYEIRHLLNKNGEDLVHVVWRENSNKTNIKSDKYYISFSSTHYLVVSGVYGSKMRENEKWLESRRHFVKAIALDLKVE